MKKSATNSILSQEVSWKHPVNIQYYVQLIGYLVVVKKVCSNVIHFPILCMKIVVEKEWSNELQYRGQKLKQFAFLTKISCKFLVSKIPSGKYQINTERPAHGRGKVHDYFLLLLCKSWVWLTEKHIFKVIIYFLIHQDLLQIMSLHLRYIYDGFIDQKILKLWRQKVGHSALADLQI